MIGTQDSGFQDYRPDCNSHRQCRKAASFRLLLTNQLLVLQAKQSLEHEDLALVLCFVID